MTKEPIELYIVMNKDGMQADVYQTLEEAKFAALDTLVKQSHRYKELIEGIDKTFIVSYTTEYDSATNTGTNSRTKQIQLKDLVFKGGK